MTNNQISNDSKLFAALSYLWLLSVVMLVLKKDDEFVKFHAKQGTVIFVASIILWFIPILGWMLQVAVLIAVVIGFLKAYSGEKYKMPVIGDLADKINI
ncbi:hypothetical protein EPN15_02470 [Patescibacteria group bacterium]|nr:MAG: hypothetical protein EPN15_02470 [Patescibacteria group bacterium]